MGTLKTGTTYIYERVGHEIYAREFGADPQSRFLIGYDYNSNTRELGEDLEQNLTMHLSAVKNDRMWKDIHQAAKTNLTLQDALDRVVEIYTLVKNNER